eukprot:TRINITY_DN34380_c0_g1_i1.p1 TRINITY_DN34380_c0_g1~~TRINITY_DN34380_c0_g1_i1.p1  ORF type:complete len:411 (+),score=76.06 TRINITY_DN34380_c0_g1_i1:54-1286(+)
MNKLFVYANKAWKELPTFDKYTTRKVVLGGWVTVSVALWFAVLGTFNKKQNFVRVFDGESNLSEYEGMLSFNCENGTAIDVEEVLTYTMIDGAEVFRGSERYVDHPIHNVRVTARNHPDLKFKHLRRGTRSVILFTGLHVPEGQELITISYTIPSADKFIIAGQDPLTESLKSTGTNTTYTLILPSIIPRMAKNYSLVVDFPFVTYTLDQPNRVLGQAEFSGVGQADASRAALHIANQVNMSTIFQTDSIGNCTTDTWKDTSLVIPRLFEPVEAHLTLVEDADTILPIEVFVFMFVFASCLFMCLIGLMIYKRDDVGFVRKLSPLEQAEIRALAILRIQALFRGFRQRKRFKVLLKESRDRRHRQLAWRRSEQQKRELKAIRHHRQSEMEKQVRFKRDIYDDCEIDGAFG